MNIPFVGLHAHDGFSIFDGMGFPSDHIDFCISNGMDALATTNHGNMNSLSYQVLHAKKLQKEGVNFKPIFGCESYFIPSISEWREEYEKYKAEKKTKDDDSISGATIEDEAATKKENKSVINRRRHLVLLAQNQKGLNNIFKLISESYKNENFYRYPRIDYSLLEKYNEGIIAMSACITADAIVDTSEGQMTMKELVDRVNNKEEIFVLSFDENTRKLVHQKVVWADLTRKNAKVVKIKLKDGKELKLTPDHKVFTDKGWLKAEELRLHKGIKILSLS
jgi:DNA polymerase III alpha subunit